MRAGLCDHPADWSWSSFRGTAGLDTPFEFVDDEPIRAYFGGNGPEALRRLRDFVDES